VRVHYKKKVARSSLTKPRTTAIVLRGCLEELRKFKGQPPKPLKAVSLKEQLQLSPSNCIAFRSKEKSKKDAEIHL